MKSANTLIAGAALVLAAVVFFRDRKRGKKQDDLTEKQAAIATRLAAIEQARRDEELTSRKRADLSVRILARPTTATSRWTYHWVIANKGYADAHDVYFQAVSVTNSSGKLPHRREQTFPIRVILAHQNFEFPGLPTQERPPYDAVLTWTDGEGEHEIRPVVSLEYET